MDRNFVTFLALAFLVLMLNSMWIASQQQRRAELAGPDAKAGAGEEAGVGEDLGADEDAGDGEAKKADEDGDSDSNRSADVEVPRQALAPAAAMPVEPQDESSQEFVTLGSVAADSPYRLLVTLTNQGAAVRRIECSSPRYRDLQDRSGYLGHLEYVDDPKGGVCLQVVGQGTPAALAGLRPGDRITALGVTSQGVNAPEAIQNTSELQQVLAKTKPGQQLAIEVHRSTEEAKESTVQCTATLARRPLEIIRPEGENILLWEDKLPADFVETPSFLLTLQQLAGQEMKPFAQDAEAEELPGVSLRESNWEIVEHDVASVTFRRRLVEQQIEIIKRYRLAEVPAEEAAHAGFPAYNLQLEIELRNLAADARDLAYRLDGPNGLPMEGWWYAYKIGRSWGGVGLRDVIARYEGAETVQFGPATIVDDKVGRLEGNPLAYIGVDAQYFSAMLLPQKTSLDERWIAEAHTILVGPKPKAHSAEKRFANVSCRLISKSQKIESGESLRHAYTIFAGPKSIDLLAHYQASGNPQYGLGDLLYYGWFSAVAKAMLAVLHFFYAIVGNYGIAIIMLTVLVRGCMFPISRKQAASMAAMQKLKPEMERLKEKYKGDMQKQSQATQELYRKHKINPMAGCLPAVIQLPVFIGLYRSLMVDIELRQAPLLGESIHWCSNLAAPDMFYDWSAIMPDFINSGIGFFGLGPYLNVLPLAATSLMLVQQTLFMPAAANEQAAMQQKIMKYMMVFMGIIFFKFAAGLSIYFIASTSWAIVERKLLPKPAAIADGNSLQATRDKKNDGGRSKAASKNGQPTRKRHSKSKRRK